MLATYVVLYSFINLTILDFLHSIEIAFFLFSLFFFALFLIMCAFVLQFSCWHVIWFYLMLMSTGCLALLTPWLFQAASTLISTSNVFIIVIYFWARVSTNKDWLIACLKPRNSVELKKAEPCTLRPKDFVSGKLPTYPFPRPTFCPKWEVSVNVGLGEGYVGSFPEKGLEITASQWTMSGLIGELTGQPFVLPVMLTGHIRSYWKWNKSKFPCCSVVSVVTSM